MRDRIVSLFSRPIYWGKYAKARINARFGSLVQRLGFPFLKTLDAYFPNQQPKNSQNYIFNLTQHLKEMRAENPIVRINLQQCAAEIADLFQKELLSRFKNFNSIPIEFQTLKECYSYLLRENCIMESDSTLRLIVGTSEDAFQIYFNDEPPKGCKKMQYHVVLKDLLKCQHLMEPIEVRMTVMARAFEKLGPTPTHTGNRLWPKRVDAAGKMLFYFTRANVRKLSQYSKLTLELIWST